MAGRSAPITRAFLRNLAGTIAAGIAVFLAVPVLAHLLRLPAGSENYQLLLAGAVLLVGYLFGRTASAAIRGWARSNDRLAHVTAVSLVVDLVIAAAVALALLGVFNVGVSNLLYGSAFTGVVLVLASQTLLGNVFAGLTLVVASPYRVGDRISLVSSSYGAIWPSYPRELTYPTYTGRVEDVELLYTILRLDTGQVAKVPNSVALQAFVVNLSSSTTRLQRVRVTLPYSVELAAFERAVGELAASLPAPKGGYPRPSAQVADLQPTTWDGVVVLWTEEASEERVRDRVLRALLAGLPLVVPAPPARPP